MIMRIITWLFRRPRVIMVEPGTNVMEKDIAARDPNVRNTSFTILILSVVLTCVCGGMYAGLAGRAKADKGAESTTTNTAIPATHTATATRTHTPTLTATWTATATWTPQPTISGTITATQNPLYELVLTTEAGKATQTPVYVIQTAIVTQIVSRAVPVTYITREAYPVEVTREVQITVPVTQIVTQVVTATPAPPTETPTPTMTHTPSPTPTEGPSPTPQCPHGYTCSTWTPTPSPTPTNTPTPTPPALDQSTPTPTPTE